MPAGPRGLKSRCLRSIALCALGTWLLLSITLLFVADRENSRSIDRALREMAQTILSFNEHGFEEVRTGPAPRADERIDPDDDGALIYQVWSVDGHLAYRSASAKDAPLTRGTPGYGRETWQGEEFRSFTTWNDAHTYQIRISAPTKKSRSHLHFLSVGVSAALLLAFSAFVILVQGQLKRSLAPLNATALSLATKSANDLSAIDPPRELPEVGLVFEEFNKFMTRVHRSVRQERRYANDAAHALRTPLSSLKILLTNVHTAPDDDERSETLAVMDDVIDRSARLVDQLLRLARIDRDPDGIDLEECVDLTQLAQVVIHDVSPLASRQDLMVKQVGATRDVWVRGNREILGLALSSLVENAVSFVEPNGIIVVEIVHESRSNLAWVRVHDDGPGVESKRRDEDCPATVTAMRPGSAHAQLGLPIVARVAEIHGGSAYIGASALLGGMAAIGLPGCIACEREMAASALLGSPTRLRNL